MKHLRERLETGLPKLKASHYKTLYMDPPWGWMRGGASAKGTISNQTGRTCVGAQGATPYEGMSTPELLALAPQIRRIMAADPHLYIWTVNKTVPDVVQMVEAYGYRWITMITWDKQKPGLAKYYQGVTEHCVFAAKGSVPYKFIDGKMAQGRTLILERMTVHSAKPAAMRAMIERVSAGPYLELFARKVPQNWGAIGLECETLPAK